jgi:hypothetical protein
LSNEMAHTQLRILAARIPMVAKVREHNRFVLLQPRDHLAH